MRILLMAMPDTVDFVDNTTRIPNLALVSLAGNLPDHEVKVMDLVAYRPHIRQAVEEILASFRPQLVGLSAMTFQFDTLLKVAGSGAPLRSPPQNRRRRVPSQPHGPGVDRRRTAAF